MTAPQHWARPLIGAAWTPTSNCWWAIREAFRLRWGIDMPALGVGDLQVADKVADIKAAATAVGFRPANGPALDGDIVLCRDLTGKRHVGMMIELRGRLLLLHNDGHMTERGPVGSVIVQPLAEASQLTAIELWRRAP